MRIGLLADIHGNLAALEAVLAALDEARVDRLVCLGDVAATGPQPAECLTRLADTGCAVVMGNADAELLAPDAMNPGDDEDSHRITRISQWSAAQLGETELASIRSFVPTVEVDLSDGGQLLCVHGGPLSFDDIITATTPDEALDRMLGGHEPAVMAGGHWHAQMLRRHRGITLVNPGSVGLVYEGLAGGGLRVPPWAECAVLEVDGDGRRSIDLRRVPYDQAATVGAMRERGMPHAGWWASDWG